MKCDVISPQGVFAEAGRQMQPAGPPGALSLALALAKKGDAFVEDGEGIVAVKHREHREQGCRKRRRDASPPRAVRDSWPKAI